MKNFVDRELIEVAYRSYGQPMKMKSAQRALQKKLEELDSEVRVVASNIAAQFKTTVQSIDYTLTKDGVIEFRVTVKEPKKFDRRRVDVKAIKPLGLTYELNRSTRGKYQFVLSTPITPSKWGLGK